MSESKANEAGEHDPVEIEWQFDALRPAPRPSGGWPRFPPSPSRRRRGTITGCVARRAAARRLLISDTDDWRIARAGFVVRTRRRGRHDEVTLKDNRPAEAAVCVSA